MLAFQNIYLGENTESIDRIVKGEQQLSVKTEIDVMGRSSKDIIDTGILESGITTSKTVSYNSNRVPTSFLGKTLGWQGRRLTSINGTGIKYQYNDAGIRTSKEVNGETTNYYLIGDKVGLLSKGESSKLFFHYNDRDMLVGFEYDKENYFYSRDLIGNITSIVDKNG